LALCFPEKASALRQLAPVSDWDRAMRRAIAGVRGAGVDDAGSDFKAAMPGNNSPTIWDLMQPPCGRHSHSFRRAHSSVSHFANKGIAD
jgi:hypothetical protein